MLGAIFSAHLPDPIPERTKRILSTAGYLAIPILFFAVWSSTGLARTLGFV